MYEFKKIKGLLTDIIENMYSQGYRLAHYDKELKISIWDRKKKVKRSQKPENVPKSSVLYTPVYKTGDSPLKYCSKLKDEKVMEMYKEFRQARWYRHKDHVSGLSEKGMFNTINKYPKVVVLKLLEFSAQEGYKKIVENKQLIEDTLNEYKIESKKQESIENGKRIEQERKDALKSRVDRIERIKNSGKSTRHWEDLAMQEIKKERPNMKEQFMLPLIPAKINTLLTEYGF